MEKQNKLNFALVGCGRIARKHYESLLAISEAELVAVCDINRDRAEACGKKLSIPHYIDYNEMLNREQIDVVSILTPSGMHADHVINIARKYKKHIVCEKPMALTLKDADRMIKVCADNKVRLFIVMQNRFNLPIIKLREAIEQGRFGRMVMGTVRVRWARDQRYYDQDKWRGTWALDGGVFANQAAHHIDLLQWMMGEVEEVTAMTATRLVDIEVEDTGIANLRFKRGALGIIEATTATRPRDMEGAISILGEQGIVEVGGFAMNEIKTWQFSEPTPEDAEIMLKYKENPADVYGFGHRRYLEQVIDCLQTNKPALVEGNEGRKSLELITALYESAEKGKTIKMATATHRSKLGMKNG